MRRTLIDIKIHCEGCNFNYEVNIFYFIIRKYDGCPLCGETELKLEFLKKGSVNEGDINR